MRCPDFNADHALVVRGASEHFYNEADARFGVVDSLNAVQEAAEAGEDVPDSLLEAAKALRAVLFGPNGIQGVGDAARDLLRDDSPVQKLRMLGGMLAKLDKTQTG